MQGGYHPVRAYLGRKTSQAVAVCREQRLEGTDGHARAAERELKLLEEVLDTGDSEPVLVQVAVKALSFCDLRFRKHCQRKIWSQNRSGATAPVTLTWHPVFREKLWETDLSGGI